MRKIPYINYKELTGFYTVQSVTRMLRLTMRELAQKVNSITSSFIGMTPDAICLIVVPSRNCTIGSITKAEERRSLVIGGMHDGHD